VNYKLGEGGEGGKEGGEGGRRRREGRGEEKGLHSGSLLHP